MLAVTPGGGQSIEPLREAARVARARGAPDLAVTFLRLALDEPPPEGELLPVLRELGTAEEMISSESCVGHLTVARDASVDSGERFEESTLSLCNGLMMLGRVPEGVAEIEAELDGDNGYAEHERELPGGPRLRHCFLGLRREPQGTRAAAALRAHAGSRRGRTEARACHARGTVRPAGRRQRGAGA